MTHNERAEAELREAWNEAQCCDDTPLGQATLAEFIADQHKCRKSAEAELHLMKTSGIIEVAIRNPSVADYMNHWEGRAESAEAELARKTEALERLVEVYSDMEDGDGNPCPDIAAARSALEEKTDV